MGVEGLSVIVTGGARGIGRHIARTFAAAGAKLVVADLGPKDDVLRELSQAGAEAIGLDVDVTDEDAVRGMAAATYRRFGRIDALINNAGIVTHFAEGAPRWPKVRDMERSFFARVVEVNLLGAFLCAKHVIPYMESLPDGGHIVNLGQGNLKPRNRGGKYGAGVYSTTKIALRAFTKELAEEERDFNIRVVSMGPRPASAPVGGGERGGAGIVTDDSPAWTRDPARGLASPPVSEIGNSYVLAAQAPMELSGHHLTVEDGRLRAVID